MEDFDVGEFTRPLRKWWWLLVVAALLAGISSAVYLMRQPKLYESRTTLMVGSFIQNPNPSGGDLMLIQQLADAYAGFIQRGALQKSTMEALQMDWLPLYSARAAAPVLEITVTDVDRERAQRVAQELANQLIKQSPAGQNEQGHQEFVTLRLKKLEADITSTEDEIERKQSELATELSASKIARMQNEITVLTNKVNSLQSTYAELLATTQKGAPNAIRVLEPAGLPEEPISSSYLMYVLVAAFFGVVLAGGSAYLIEYLDDSVRTVDQIERLSGTPTLGAIPTLGDGKASADDKLIMLRNSMEPTAEAYRVLRTNLQFAAVDHPLQTLQVTSPSPGEGKSITVANLSAALAYSGMRVILVDADFRRPMQHKFFKLANNMGVTSALLGEPDTIARYLRQTSVPNLRILTSGPLPPNPSELLGSQRMQQLLAALRRDADIIVIDSPPVMSVSDATGIAGRVDGVVMVIKAGHTRRDVVKNAFRALQQVNARILGTVLNEVQGKESGHYFNSSSKYGYSYERKSSASSPISGEGNRRAEKTPSAVELFRGRAREGGPGPASAAAPAPVAAEPKGDTAA